MDPTKVNAGLNPALAAALSKAQRVSKCRIEIEYDFSTATMTLNAPADPVAFFGVMKMAEDYWKVLRAQAQQNQLAEPEKPQEVRQ